MYAQQYSNVKAGGIGCIYAWDSVRGVAVVITNIEKGVIIYYSKRQFAAVYINASAYVLSPTVVVFNNASKIVNISKGIHSTA